MLNNENQFAKLPIEVLIKIFSYLGPEDIENQQAVSKQFLKAASAQDLWQHKFSLHFPHKVNGVLQSGKAINWYQQFCNAYNFEYASLSTSVRELFSTIKERDIERLAALSTSVKELFSTIKEKDIERLAAALDSIDFKDLISKIDVNGWNMLDWARKTKDNQAILDLIYRKIVIENNDFASLENATDLTKLHWAVLCNQSETIIRELIADGLDVNSKNHIYGTAMSIACSSGLDNIVRVLLSAEVDPNVTGFTYPYCTSSPLIMAVAEGKSGVVDILLAVENINVNATNLMNQTALHCAAEAGNNEMVTKLLEKGRNINIPSHFNVVPLHLAAGKGHLETVVKLLNEGAYVNATNEANYTPLHEAAENGHLKVIIKLLQSGADLNARTKTGKSAIELANKKGHGGVGKFLQFYKEVQDISIKHKESVGIVQDALLRLQDLLTKETSSPVLEKAIQAFKLIAEITVFYVPSSTKGKLNPEEDKIKKDFFSATKKFVYPEKQDAIIEELKKMKTKMKKNFMSSFSLLFTDKERSPRSYPNERDDLKPIKKRRGDLKLKRNASM